jgi:hypothetical protein
MQVYMCVYPPEGPEALPTSRKSCRKKALADPDKTLAKVKELKEKAAGPTRQ